MSEQKNNYIFSQIFSKDMESVEKLAKLVADNDLEEITVKEGEMSITVKGKKCPPPLVGTMPMMPAASAQTTAESPAQEEKPISGKVIKAPLVGTFYAAPAPDQPPFVQVGDTVKKGDVVLIIESMKLMNEVTSDVDGVVKEILVNNGDAVEYDQPLIVLS